MNFINVWLALPMQRRIISVLSVVATLIALFVMTNVVMKPKLSLLYSGLDPASAGDVIAKLDGLSVDYDVRGDAIFAESKRRDSLRLELAREGLPRQSVVGYELFDNLNSFAMSAEMFDTAYWRAKEGELARTLLAMRTVSAARVHLGAKKSTGFRKNAQAGSASVTLTTSGGLNVDQAKAVQYLVAQSIVGLAPESVAVIDTVRGLIVGPGINAEEAMDSDGEFERAAELKRNLLSLLEARVGAGNARVSVSLELERKRETTTERSFDPEGRVVRTQNTTETSGNSTGSSAAVTVASNLPEGAGGAGESNSENTEINETVTYEISEILRNTETAPGAVKRLSVAVLVNDIATTDAEGAEILTPRGAAEISILETLISSASGLDLERGDQLTVQSLAFDRPEVGTLITKPSAMDIFMEQYLWSTVQSVFLGIVALILGLFVIRPMMTRSPAIGNTASALMPMSLESSSLDAPLLGGPVLSEAGESLPALPQIGQPMTALSLDGPPSEDPMQRLADATLAQPDDAAELLASWLSTEPASETASTPEFKA
jgi:flagellar M-ring protein FliF